MLLPQVAANCRTCRCNIKTEAALLAKKTGVATWNKNICSSGRKTFFGKLFGHISCNKAGDDCPGHCEGWARGKADLAFLGKLCRQQAQATPGAGTKLLIHSQVTHCK